MDNRVKKILDHIEECRIDELSNEKLIAYRKKAAEQKRNSDKDTENDAVDIRTWRNDVQNSANRARGIDAANKRLIGDDVEESMVAREQGGRKMVSAEAALRHAREIAHKRAPGSKPTMSDIAQAHRNLTSGIKHESEEIDELSIDLLSRYKKKASDDSRAADAAGDVKKADKRFSGVVKATTKQFAKFEKKPVAEEVESIDESFAVKDSSGKTVDVKFSESEAMKRAEELTKKTGQKHSVKFERTAMVRTVKEDTDGKDTVTLEIPALIRALEWAREDAEDDAEIHKFVEKLINHEGTVDMGFFSEGVVPSADRKIDKNGRPYPAHQVHIGTNDSRKRADESSGADHIEESNKFTFASLDVSPDHPIVRHTPYQGVNVGELFKQLNKSEQ